MGKRYEHRSGGRCESLIKHLKISAFQKLRVQGSTAWDSRLVEPLKISEPSDLRRPRAVDLW
jgi:hypothetical protein